MSRCQRMDLTAETKVITPTVERTAPPISIAGLFADLFDPPSYNIKSPRTKSVADKMISKTVDILLIGKAPSFRMARHRRAQ
jgi:hypothetical protein